MKDRCQTNLTTGDEKCLTRRQVLKTFGAGAVAATIGASLPCTFASAGSRPATPVNYASPLPEGWPNQGVTPRATAFDLAHVRLLEGPFRQAQERDGRYL